MGKLRSKSSIQCLWKERPVSALRGPKVGSSFVCWENRELGPSCEPRHLPRPPSLSTLSLSSLGRLCCRHVPSSPTPPPPPHSCQPSILPCWRSPPHFRLAPSPSVCPLVLGMLGHVQSVIQCLSGQYSFYTCSFFSDLQSHTAKGPPRPNVCK